MKKLSCALLLSVAATSLQAQSLSEASRKSILSEPDRTIWDVPTSVVPGSVLETNPANWSDKNGAFFRVFSHFLERKIDLTPIDPAQKESHTTTITKKVDISAILPFLKMFSASFAHSHVISLTENNAVVSQVDYPDARKKLHFYDTNRVPDKDQESDREDLFGSLRAGARAAGGKSESSHYWIVLKTWQPDQQIFKDNKGTAVALNAGCAGVSDTAGKALQDAQTSTDSSPKPDQNSPDQKAASDQKDGADQKAPAATNAAIVQKVAPAKTDNLTGNAQFSFSKTPTATIGAAVGGSGTAKADSKPSVVSVSCQFGQASGVSANNVFYTSGHPISSILIAPIFVDSRGLLYIPMPDSNDTVLAPRVVSRSQ